MTTCDNLLQAILDDPEDLGARLVYADWLEEQGQGERAEFIRVQLRLAELRDQGCHEGETCNVTGICAECNRDVEAEPLRRRERELFANSGPLWWNPLPGSYRATESADISITTAEGWKYLVRRGFVEEVHCRLEDWVGGECRRKTCHSGTVMTNALGTRRCKYCRGTGRIPGHGAAIMKCQPVTKVATEKKPYHNSMYDWVWLSDQIHDKRALATVPHALFALLLGGEASLLETACYYNSESAALDALSRAAILLAKEQPCY